MTQYMITSSGQYHWENVNATTLRGAKMIASRTFCESVGGKIEVGIKHAYELEHGTEYDIQTVAVKYGFDKWHDVI